MECSGLVGEDHFGAGDHGAGDADQLLLATGELVGVKVLFADDAFALDAFVEGVNGVIKEVVFAGPVGILHADEVEQRGFAGPGRSRDGEELAFADFQIYTS